MILTQACSDVEFCPVVYTLKTFLLDVTTFKPLTGYPFSHANFLHHIKTLEIHVEFYYEDLPKTTDVNDSLCSKL